MTTASVTAATVTASAKPRLTNGAGGGGAENSLDADAAARIADLQAALEQQVRV